MATVDEVVRLIHEKFGVEPDMLDPTKPLTEFGLDSLSLIELIFTVEEHFKVEISDHAEINNITDLATLIDKLHAAKKV